MPEVHDALARSPEARPSLAKPWLARLNVALTRRGDGALRGFVYLLIDCSTSMSDGKKLAQAKLGALRFAAEAWQREYAVGIIRFSTNASCLLGARRLHPRLPASLQRLEADGRTAMAEAIDLARGKLAKRKGARVICLITDGKPDCREAALRSAALARACGIDLVALGTDGADEAFLSAVATREALGFKVPRGELEQGVAAMAGMLPGGTKGTAP